MRCESLRRACWFLVALAGCDSSPEPSPQPPPRPEGVEVEEIRPITLTPYARLPEQDARFRSVEVFEDRLVFHYDGAPETPLEENQVVAGVQGDGYLRRIMEITDHGDGTWTATTIHAELGELIQDGHFRVRMEPGDSSYVPPPGAEVENLNWSLLPPGGMLPCSAGRSGSVQVSPSMSAHVGMELEIDIRFCWREGFWGIQYPAGCFHSARFIASGSLGAGVEIAMEGDAMVSCNVNLVPRHLADRYTRQWRTTFSVGPVPITVIHTIRPAASLEASGSITAGRTTVSKSGSVSIRAGAEYWGGRWQHVWDPSARTSGSASTNSCGGWNVEASINTSVEYSLKVYDAAGPSISFGPRVSGSFRSSGADAMWTGEVNVGLGGQIGAALDVPVIDVTLAEMSWDLPSVNLFERMYSGPVNRCADASTDAGWGVESDAANAPDAGVPPFDAGYSHPDAHDEWNPDANLDWRRDARDHWGPDAGYLWGPDAHHDWGPDAGYLWGPDGHYDWGPDAYHDWGPDADWSAPPDASISVWPDASSSSLSDGG